MMRSALACLALLAPAFLASAPARASGLRVSEVRLVRPESAVELTAGWENAWRSERNHDGAWIFVKLRQEGRASLSHARLARSGHRVETLAGAKAALEVQSDGTGAFVYPSDRHRGPMKATLRLALDPAVLASIDAKTNVEMLAFGVEMVLVPEGPFTTGDPDPRSHAFGAYFRAGKEGVPDGLFPIASESGFPVGAREGALEYRARDPQYQGDRLGPVPDGYPKGFRAFWLMKYELTQGAYAAFLNALNGQATYFRAIHGGRDYAKSRGAISFENGLYAAKTPDRPANWVSWDDGTAWADWAGLRPFTELEFDKACRGPGAPIAGEFPWGTASKERLKRRVRPDDDLERAGEADESLLSDATKDVLGASFYWVMDLAGSVWERVVTLGHPAGRAFRGSHGDGRLDDYGFATNEDWPKGDVGRGGYGYRGGGYYEHGMKESEFNPWSPIAYRRFGAWGDAPRSIAYGFRAARTREQNGARAR